MNNIRNSKRFGYVCVAQITFSFIWMADRECTFLVVFLSVNKIRTSNGFHFSLSLLLKLSMSFFRISLPIFYLYVCLSIVSFSLVSLRRCSSFLPLNFSFLFLSVLWRSIEFIASCHWVLFIWYSFFNVGRNQIRY